MTKLRKLARGQECLVRIPLICNGNPETTVLAHLNMSGISGRGIKSPDIFGAYCCSSCHDEIDRRTQYINTNDVAVMFYEGIFRTQYKLIQDGVIK